ncbi:hypothetical protein BJ742DRAFT_828251 [Cladochytrium replicatum]|nr:hypothetical protein BJ742DRAFT_828251 [Cladochytrium replicatum]
MAGQSLPTYGPFKAPHVKGRWAASLYMAPVWFFLMYRVYYDGPHHFVCAFYFQDSWGLGLMKRLLIVVCLLLATYVFPLPLTSPPWSFIWKQSWVIILGKSQSTSHTLKRSTRSTAPGFLAITCTMVTTERTCRSNTVLV